MPANWISRCRSFFESWWTIFISLILFLGSLIWLKAEPNNHEAWLSVIVAASALLLGIVFRLLPTVQEEQKILLAENLAQLLRNHYRTNEYFTQIRIIGDKDSVFGRLDMGEYFIQLSYLEHQKLADRESLLKEELQAAVEKTKTPSIFRSEFSVSAISDNILSNNHQIVVSGNPGVGKSTYAKWLCHQWGLGRLNGQRVLIFIELRRVDFGQPYFLAHEIIERYLSGYRVAKEDLQDLLRDFPNDYMLVLDGLDELNTALKHKLFAELDRYFPKVNYLLLSRPYGLIGLPFQPGAHFRIDGFNDANIRQYIRTMLAKSGTTGKTEIEILQILANNKVLYDYAHAPLMLSYILLIYLTNPTAVTTLHGIDSLYQLQREVFAWVIYYEKTKGNPLLSDKHSVIFRDLNSLAYQMQVGKRFIWKGSLQDDFEPMAEDLASLGFGNKRNNALSADWQFSFHTVTFQEFLAAEFVHQRITPESVVYLLEDRFFWNFVRFLVGKISFEEKNGTLKGRLANLFHRLQQEAELGNHNYLAFLYYLLIGECSRETVQSLLDKKDLDRLITFFEKNYFDDHWQGIILDAVAKIHPKLSPLMQAHYKKNLLRRINNTKLSKSLQMSEMQQSLYLLSLLKSATLISDYDIMNASVDLLEFMFPKAQQIQAVVDTIEDLELIYTEKKYQDLTANLAWYFNMSNFYVSLLLEAEPVLLTPFTERIKRLGDICPDDFIQNMVKLISRVEEVDVIFIEAEHQCQLLEEIAAKDPTSWDEENDGAQLMGAAECLSKIGSKHGKTPDTHSPELIDLTRRLSILILQLLELAKTSEEESTNEAARLALYGLTEFDEPKVYDLLFEFANRFEHGLYLNVPGNDTYIQYVEGLLEKVNNPANGFNQLEYDEQVSYLLAGISQSENARFAFSRMKDGLLAVFNDLYILSLDEEKSSEEKASYHAYMIEIAALPYYPFDKKHLLNKVLELGGLSDPQLKTIAVSIICSYEFPFYEEAYWEVFFEAFDDAEADKFDMLHEFFNNDGVFEYQSNLPYLNRILTEIQQYLMQPNQESSESDIVGFVSQSLYLYQKSDAKYRPDDMLQQTEAILLNKRMLKAIKLGIGEHPEALTAYLFQHFLKPFPKNPLKGRCYLKIIMQQYSETFPGQVVDASTLTAVLEKMLRFITNNERGLSLVDAERFNPVMGKKLETVFLEHVHKYLFYKDDFEQATFERLLNCVLLR